MGEGQGHSPFVWAVLGAIAQATDRLRGGTGVTCPTIRTHPAIVAQAAATTACLMPGRFFLSVGSGEALNEHIFGHHLPPAPERLAMLEEAIEVIRLRWQGGDTGRLSHHLPTPKHLEDAAGMITEVEVAEKVVCGPDVARHAELVKKYADAGFTHVYIHQVGPDQGGFFRFWETELRPALVEQGLAEAG